MYAVNTKPSGDYFAALDMLKASRTTLLRLLDQLAYLCKLQTIEKLIELVHQTEDEDKAKLTKLYQSADSQCLLLVIETHKAPDWSYKHRPAPLPKYPKPSSPQDELVNEWWLKLWTPRQTRAI